MKPDKLLEKLERILQTVNDICDNPEIPYTPREIHAHGSLVQGKDDPEDLDLIMVVESLNKHQVQLSERCRMQGTGMGTEMDRLLKKRGERVDILYSSQPLDEFLQTLAGYADGTPETFCVWRRQDKDYGPRVAELRRAISQTVYHEQPRQGPKNQFLEKFKKQFATMMIMDGLLTDGYLEGEFLPLNDDSPCDLWNLEALTHGSVRERRFMEFERISDGTKRLCYLAGNYLRERGKEPALGRTKPRMISEDGDIAIDIGRVNLSLARGLFVGDAAYCFKEMGFLPAPNKKEQPVLYTFRRTDKRVPDNHPDIFFQLQMS